MDAYDRMHQKLDDGDVDYVLTWCETIAIYVELRKHTLANALEIHFGNLLRASLIVRRIYNDPKLNPNYEYEWCDICNWAYRRDDGAHADCEKMFAHGEHALMFAGFPLFREAPRFNEEYGRKAFSEGFKPEDDGIVVDLADLEVVSSTPGVPQWFQNACDEFSSREGA